MSAWHSRRADVAGVAEAATRERGAVDGDGPEAADGQQQPVDGGGSLANWQRAYEAALEDPTLIADLETYDFEIQEALGRHDTNLVKMLEMGMSGELGAFRLPPELLPGGADADDKTRALELVFSAKGILDKFREGQAAYARHLASERGQFMEMHHLTLSGLPKLTRLDSLAECTALRTLTLEGLEHVHALPDLSALSGLEMHAGEGLAPSVRAWAEAHAGRKAKGGE